MSISEPEYLAFCTPAENHWAGFDGSDTFLRCPYDVYAEAVTPFSFLNYGTPYHNFDVAYPISNWCSSEGSSDGFLEADCPKDEPWNGQSLSDVEEEKVNRSVTSESAMKDRQMSRSVSLAPSMGTFSDDSFEHYETGSWASGENRDPENNKHDCPDCKAMFYRVFELEEHAKQKGHKPFECGQCNKWFSRRDALGRHADLHRPRGLHPCPRCDKYQGRHAFKRRDHLRKHLRNVHQDMGCPRPRPQNTSRPSSERICFKKFDQRREYTKKMREGHRGETHDCAFDGCGRTGSKGFVRRLDLERHLTKEHSRTSSEIDGNVVD